MFIVYWHCHFHNTLDLLGVCMHSLSNAFYTKEWHPFPLKLQLFTVKCKAFCLTHMHKIDPISIVVLLGQAKDYYIIVDVNHTKIMSIQWPQCVLKVVRRLTLLIRFIWRNAFSASALVYTTAPAISWTISSNLILSLETEMPIIGVWVQLLQILHAADGNWAWFMTDGVLPTPLLIGLTLMISWVSSLHWRWCWELIKYAF